MNRSFVNHGNGIRNDSEATARQQRDEIYWERLNDRIDLATSRKLVVVTATVNRE